jgi:hypothetical protein
MEIEQSTKHSHWICNLLTMSLLSCELTRAGPAERELNAASAFFLRRTFSSALNVALRFHRLR